MNDDKFDLEEQNFSADEIAEMMSPALAEKRAQEKRHQQFILDVLSGDTEDNAGPYERRCIVERDVWYVPQRPDGAMEILNVRRGDYQPLIARVNKKDGRRNVREGMGGQMLPIYQVKPDGPCAEFDGRTLVRSLPSNLSGLLVQHRVDEPLRELYAEHFNNLLSLADAVDMEDALVVEGPLAIASLMKFKFRVAMYNNGFLRKDHVVPVATCEESQFFEVDDCTVELMTGRNLFEKVLRDGTYCGIVVNRLCDMGRNGEHLGGLLFSMDFIHRALNNDSCELRVAEYVVRCREEFELWLDFVLFPSEERQIIEEKDERGKSFVHAVSRARDCEWNIRECDVIRKTDEAVTPKFEIRANPGAPHELANGLSPVLCPGLIAKRLWMMLDPDRNRRENKWCPGRSVLFGRVLSDEDVAKSRLRVRLANELLKFFGLGADSLDLRATRSVAGARFLESGWCPAAKTRAWVETALAQSEQYSRKFVFGFGA